MTKTITVAKISQVSLNRLIDLGYKVKIVQETQPKPNFGTLPSRLWGISTKTIYIGRNKR